MDAIGTALASTLEPSDLVALHGPLGVGKSHLARAIIRARLEDPAAEVPSPSYTLVNIYNAAGVELWHADLYRVGPEEIDELGLADAPREAILIIEWAELWPGLPARRLDIDIAFASAEGRNLTAKARGGGWKRPMQMLGEAA